ncbi:aldehyde dehydrogenase iron-sulfur subunit [Aminivibrio pyruvatiphilus]|uniref:Aldehyde dehydrogenase iron-sulfur subunit n=1 Tax=Aminivibrio pyruvatiphilus TaxID=1005740 RepID=A0A4R8MCY0_9BACT|nr:pyridine nucleotide-disulfide oxidoreductase/dicluster-binding protein [Aminivibrio pyruvatiphilus]TDY61636.1 aldehyde dehydrogenase iron-sulfur subunit [Aminivibrio pyruvatiphilus]
MEKSTLVEFESKCVQEEPPRCRAACPLHLDGRALCEAAVKGRFDEGRKIIQKTLPLPGILARICDAPCRDACLRQEKGGALELGALERFCADEGSFRRPRILVPKTGRTAAVLGGGISSLTAALDGAGKGYSVTVFRAENGGRELLSLSPLLTEDVVREELEWMEKLGVHFLPWDASVTPEGLAERFDAVYAGLDDPLCRSFPELLERGDPVSLETAVPGVFAGGNTPSFIFRAAAGRRGMKSVERFLQGASLTSSREKEGPYETRLFTNTEGIEPVPPVPVPPRGYSRDDAVREAGRCLLCECLECVKSCVFLQNYRGYPKKFAREIYNNLSVIQGTRLANGMINSCTLCGQCERICPEGFSMRDLCLTARQEMVLQQKMPPSAHEFALEDMAFGNSPGASLLRHEPGLRGSAFLFFPGCRLAGISPRTTKAVYGHLRRIIGDGVGFWLRCCGAPARWAGRRQELEKEGEEFLSQWRSMGSPVVIAACTSCLEVFRKELPEIRAVSLWSVLQEKGVPDVVPVCSASTVLHDPCTAAELPEVRAAVRELASRAGAAAEELPLSGGLTSCCGFGGLQECANPGLAAKTAQERCGESPSDYLVYCAMCRDLFARTGKRTVHLLDLFFPPPDGTGEDLPPVSWSEQRENRAALVRELRKSLWEEEEKMEEEWETLPLVMDGETEKMLQSRRILTGTVRQAIWNGETSGRKIARPDGTLITSLKPASVTYWVVYRSLENGTFEVLNGWSHRMEVKGTERRAP